MKASSYRDLTREELDQKLRDLRGALFNLKFQHATNQLENTAQLRKTRKGIAQILTVFRQMGQKV
jgi:large subunit ribosomal protein L29